MKGETTKCAETAGPMVSVVLPVYNGERFLGAAVDSILAQTYTNFELIMIDDGSKDGSAKILKQYEQQDPRVRVIVRENRGLATTLNDSIDVARGKWIARMDQDDIALPTRFERQLLWLEKTASDIAGSWVQRFGTSDRRIVRLRQTDEAIKTEMLFSCPFAHPAVMMRTSLAKKLRYDPAWDKAEDYDLWERAAEDGWKMGNVPEILLLYRVHGSQISTATAAKQHELTLQIQRRYWEYLGKGERFEQGQLQSLINIYGGAWSLSDLDGADAVLAALLGRRCGEAREVVISHITRLYRKVAADCPAAASRWGKFVPEMVWHKLLTTKLQLWVLRVFRIRPGRSKIFALLRAMAIALVRK